MEITLNAQSISTDATSLRGLVDSLNLKASNIVIELNLKIIKKENWEQTAIHQDDCVEVITFMGGG